MSRRPIIERGLNAEDAFGESNAIVRRDYDAMLEQQLGGNIVAELSGKCDAQAREIRQLKAQVASLRMLWRCSRILRWLENLFARKEPR